MVRHVLVVALMVGMVHGIVWFPNLTIAAPAAHTTAAEQGMAQGWNASQRGAFAEAVRAWLAAADHYKQAGQPRGQTTALTQLAHAYQALGQYRKAVQTVLGSLGQVSLITGPLDAAQETLQEGLRLSREAGNTTLTAAILNDLGNVLASQHKYGEALNVYMESVQGAEQSHEHALAGRALTNAAVASTQQEQPQAARMWLDMALEHMREVAPSHKKAYDLMNIGLAYDSLRASLSEAQAGLTRRAADALHEAANIARTLNDQRALSYAWGHLGKLYEEERRYAEALQLTRQGIVSIIWGTARMCSKRRRG